MRISDWSSDVCSSDLNTSTGDTVYMRGFDASSSIFVDGIRDLGSVSHDIFNIDQIEVEKGPAGTDNGRTSPSGAINMTTKQANRSEEHTSELQSLKRLSYAVFCLKKNKTNDSTHML